MSATARTSVMRPTIWLAGIGTTSGCPTRIEGAGGRAQLRLRFAAARS
jgi:hypothetical protein